MHLIFLCLCHIIRTVVEKKRLIGLGQNQAKSIKTFWIEHSTKATLRIWMPLDLLTLSFILILSDVR